MPDPHQPSSPGRLARRRLRVVATFFADAVDDALHGVDVVLGEVGAALAQHAQHRAAGRRADRAHRGLGVLVRGVGGQPVLQLPRGHVDQGVELVPQGVIDVCGHPRPTHRPPCEPSGTAATGGGRGRRVERDRDGVVAERLRHPGEHRTGVVRRAGGEVALRRGGVQLGRGDGVAAGCCPGAGRRSRLHALHQAPLPADDAGLRRIQHSRGEHGRRQVDGGLLAVARWR